MGGQRHQQHFIAVPCTGRVQHKHKDVALGSCDSRVPLVPAAGPAQQGQEVPLILPGWQEQGLHPWKSSPTVSMCLVRAFWRFWVLFGFFAFPSRIGCGPGPCSDMFYYQ